MLHERTGSTGALCAVVRVPDHTCCCFPPIEELRLGRGLLAVHVPIAQQILRGQRDGHPHGGSIGEHSASRNRGALPARGPAASVAELVCDVGICNLSLFPLHSTSHGQHYAVLCLAAQHSSISLARLFERVGFDHRTHAGQFAEAERVLGIGRRACGPALNGSTSGN